MLSFQDFGMVYYVYGKVNFVLAQIKYIIFDLVFKKWGSPDIVGFPKKGLKHPVYLQVLYIIKYFLILLKSLNLHSA